MKCSKCGTEFESNFCPECGTPKPETPPEPEAPKWNYPTQNPEASEKPDTLSTSAEQSFDPTAEMPDTSEPVQSDPAEVPETPDVSKSKEVSRATVFKIIAFSLAALLIALSLNRCYGPQSKKNNNSSGSSLSSQGDAKFSEDYLEGVQVFEQDGIYLEIPKSWEKEESDDCVYYDFPSSDSSSDFSAFLAIQIDPPDFSIMGDITYSIFKSMLQDSGEVSIISEKTYTNSNNIDSRYIEMNVDMQEIKVLAEMYIFDAPNAILSLVVATNPASDIDYSKDFAHIVNSVRFVENDESLPESQEPSEPQNEPSEPQNEPSSKPETNEEQKPPKTQSETSSKPETNQGSGTVATGKSNALKKAKDYLSFMPFSYQGLIKQLEYENYSHEEAVYGADNCNANWNEQALKSAKNYLGTTAFSYQGLIKQLEYEGFTYEQAVYGVDNCNANWNEQAAKSAKNYLETMAFSRDELIAQLEYEGFTHEQAVYGAQANGY